MLVGALVVFVCAAVVAWVLVGDRSSPGRRPDELDHIVRVDVPDTVEAVAGIAGGAVLLLTIAVLVRKRVPAAWWHVFVAVLLAGAIVGAGGRVITAGTIGANIGAGLVLYVGGPVVVLLLAYAVLRAIRVRARA